MINFRVDYDFGTSKLDISKEIYVSKLIPLMFPLIQNSIPYRNALDKQCKIFN